jgi:uncharacterized tellurite resistance protein B-like protein
MFEFVKSLFHKGEEEGQNATVEAAMPEAADVNNIPLAAAVLLVEAAIMDDSFEATEEKVIIELLQHKFDCTRPEAVQLLQIAAQEAEDQNRFYYYTKTLKDKLTETGRREIVGMLWEVAYADGIIHDYEANLLRRVCGLLYISDQESANLRQQVEERLARQKEASFLPEA